MTRWRGLLLVLVLVSSAVAPATGLVTAQDDSPTPTPGANDTRHVDPDESSGNGDLLGVQSALARRMAQRLQGSSVQLSQDQYELANDLIGQEYQDQYGKYVDVAGETDREDRAEEFETARDRQERFNQHVREYNRKFREYQEAKRNGNDQRARRLARELNRLSENVSGTGDRLRGSYRVVGNASGVDMTEGRVAVNGTVENVTERQSDVRAAEFEPTTLTLSSRSDRAAFDDPLVLEGRVTTENGTALADREISLQINDRRLLVETDDTGRFTAQYRPVTMPIGPSEATVRYVPADTSVYLGSQANTSFTVEQVASTVTIRSANERASFGQGVIVSGVVEAAGQRVPGVPVVVTVGGTKIATGTTNADGELTVAPDLPASIATGNRTLRVAVAQQDRAVGPSNATQQLRVTETPTNLTLSTTASSTSITLTGALQTDTGAGVAGQELEIRRNGSVVGTTRTNDAGRYRVDIPAGAGERARVTVRYDEPTTNLGNASATALVTVPTNQSADGLLTDAGFLEQLQQLLISPLGLGGLGLLLVALLAGGAWLVSRQSEAEHEGHQAPTATTANSDTGTAATPTSAEREPLAEAQATLPENPDATVELAYRSIRNRLRERGLGSDAATHWEFFRTCADAGLDGLDALERLTVTYEQAAFGPTSVSSEQAAGALEAAESLTAD